MLVLEMSSTGPDILSLVMLVPFTVFDLVGAEPPDDFFVNVLVMAISKCRVEK